MKSSSIDTRVRRFKQASVSYTDSVSIIRLAKCLNTQPYQVIHLHGFVRFGFEKSARTLMISETIVYLNHPTRLSSPEDFTEFSPGKSFTAGFNGRSHAEIVGLNPAGGMDVCCVLSGRGLCEEMITMPRGVLQTAVRRCA